MDKIKNFIVQLKKEIKTLHTPTKEELIKDTAGTMIASVILSFIVFGLSSGMTQIIGFFIK